MAPSHLDYSMELHKNSKHYGASDSYTSKTEVKQLYNISKGINDLNKNKTKITSILDYDWQRRPDTDIKTSNK